MRYAKTLDEALFDAQQEGYPVRVLVQPPREHGNFIVGDARQMPNAFRNVLVASKDGHVGIEHYERPEPSP